jgi:hypothetical protein
MFSFVSPVLPQDIEALIITPSDSFCVAFKKLLHAVYLYYKWVKYCNASDGLIADLHAVDLCSSVHTHCPDTSTDS